MSSTLVTLLYVHSRYCYFYVLVFRHLQWWAPLRSSVVNTRHASRNVTLRPRHAPTFFQKPQTMLFNVVNTALTVPVFSIPYRTLNILSTWKPSKSYPELLHRILFISTSKSAKMQNPWFWRFYVHFQSSISSERGRQSEIGKHHHDQRRISS